ncbi:glycerol uptake facilitator protein [Pedobacter sp. W3I1]|uniref:MIP/aquaporin family protein n=1 Tax=Pedobacter sp. W3I1 TaxID=3042291 RepID=UPI0027873903|nr:MIP/aquaporin family protein [Pedobacter sp. W3I1]MDQ0639477.1 glycerol uptake facilitator protein [Pedobacter sp. W3I1]
MNVYLAEFIGTALMILLGNGVVANVVLKGTKGNNSGWIVITTAWALAVFVGVVVAGPYSGAHLNPIVTLGLAIGKGFSWALVPFYIIAQLAGAMTGSFLVWLIYKDHFDATDDQGLKAAPFATAPAIRNMSSNLVSEIIGTFVLIFVIFYFTDASMGTKETVTTPIGLGSMGAIPVAFLVWVIGLALGGTTGYAINPARDLGPRIIHFLIPMKGKGSSDWGYAWVPIVGPIIGSVLAAVAFLLISK